MKLRCPRCEKVLNVPDKYAGKAIRCPACNRGFQVPQLKQTTVAAGGGGDLDLESLARLEQGTQQLGEEERAALEQAAAENAGDLPPGVRICPHCGTKCRAEDNTVEILCSHCWKPIDATASGGLGSGRKVKQAKKFAPFGKGGFYTEIGRAIAYPTGASGSIFTASLIAFLAGVLPVMAITVGATVMTFSSVGTSDEGKAADLSSAASVVMLIFFAEVVFFSGVAIHAFFDIVRSTGIGEDKPPKLTWSLGDIGKSVSSYLALGFAYGLYAWAIAKVTGAEDALMRLFTEQDPWALVQITPYVVFNLLYIFFYPMMLIGVALGNLGQAINPLNVAKSVIRTHVHYLFLFFLVILYLMIFMTSFLMLVVEFLVPKITSLSSEAGAGAIGIVALSLLSWGAVMGFFFYGAYVIARFHGLFVRSFRDKLEFGTK